MDPQVLWALEALDHWASFLADRDPEFVVQLAIRSLEAVDYEVSARLDDFLASPEMAAEFDRIAEHLRWTSRPQEHSRSVCDHSGY
ncbi:hypothetical protein OG205_10730 [Lentzea sp. NBC_00516]|uniref:hypothetical protein n=1 Tax=Lentzea sp. NBC_00516 TaxID=2903582 RepID=UPI002E80F205|nr:hypothetical protein [Lentzea sp. NBC_00516]WUD27438.1 hypothetical protein OG205_10730 [Lentzea sp. NBC_00516]